MKKASKKLNLMKETVKQLTSGELAQVGGAAHSKRRCFNTDACPTALNTCSC